MARKRTTSRTSVACRPGLVMLSEVEHPVEPRTPEQTAATPPPTAMITQLTAKCFICKKQLTHSKTPNTGYDHERGRISEVALEEVSTAERHHRFSPRRQ